MPDNQIKLSYSPLDDDLFVTSEYGPRIHPEKLINQDHLGMDLRAPVGTNLYNAHDGEVIFAGLAGGYGNAAVIRDPKTGQSTLYAHLSEIGVAKGDLISGRTLIGKTGKSGTRQAHLHMEIIDNTVSDQISGGVLAKGAGGRIDPRIVMSNSFPATFPTAIRANQGSYDLIGTDLDETLSGNDLPNNFQGGGGYNKFRNVGSGDLITGTNHEGEIFDTDGDSLAGSATPRKVNGQIIPNQFVSKNGKHLLVKVGNDLWMMDRNVPPSQATSAENPHATIKDFSDADFGIYPGQRQTDEIISTQIASDIYSGPLLPAAEKPTFYALSQRSIGDDIEVPRMIEHSAKGNPIGEVYFSNKARYEVGLPLTYNQNGKTIVVAPFNSFNEEVGAALFDPSSGKVLAKQIFDETGVAEDGSVFTANPIGLATVSSEGDSLYFHSQRSYTRNGRLIKVEHRVQELSKNLEPIGEVIIAQPGQQFGGFPSRITTPSAVTLTNGATVSFGLLGNQPRLTIGTPKLENIPDTETPNEIIAAPGITATAVPGSFLVFPKATPEKRNEIGIPEESGNYYVSGLGGNNRLNLGALNINTKDIVSGNLAEISGDASVQDLLNQDPCDAQVTRRDLGNDDDDYGAPPSNDDQVNQGSGQKITRLSFNAPSSDGKTCYVNLYLSGTSKDEVLNNIGNLFTGFIAPTTSTTTPASTTTTTRLVTSTKPTKEITASPTTTTKAPTTILTSAPAPTRTKPQVTASPTSTTHEISSSTTTGTKRSSVDTTTDARTTTTSTATTTTSRSKRTKTVEATSSPTTTKRSADPSTTTSTSKKTKTLTDSPTSTTRAADSTSTSMEWSTPLVTSSSVPTTSSSRPELPPSEKPAEDSQSSSKFGKLGDAGGGTLAGAGGVSFLVFAVAWIYKKFFSKKEEGPRRPVTRSQTAAREEEELRNSMELMSDGHFVHVEKVTEQDVPGLPPGTYKAYPDRPSANPTTGGSSESSSRLLPKPDPAQQGTETNV